MIKWLRIYKMFESWYYVVYELINGNQYMAYNQNPLHTRQEAEQQLIDVYGDGVKEYFND